MLEWVIAAALAAVFILVLLYFGLRDGSDEIAEAWKAAQKDQRDRETRLREGPDD